MPAFRNSIVIYLAQSELQNSLNEAADPLWTTIVHEYTHVLHIDQLRGAGWFWRVLFGKLYFPNSATFNWNVEGMATLTESIFSDTGRLRSAYSEALIADAADIMLYRSFVNLFRRTVSFLTVMRYITSERDFLSIFIQLMAGRSFNPSL